MKPKLIIPLALAASWAAATGCGVSHAPRPTTPSSNHAALPPADSTAMTTTRTDAPLSSPAPAPGTDLATPAAAVRKATFALG